MRPLLTALSIRWPGQPLTPLLVGARFSRPRSVSGVHGSGSSSSSSSGKAPQRIKAGRGAGCVVEEEKEDRP